MKKYSIDIVRAEDPYYNGLLALLFSALKKKPLLIGVWGNPGAVRKYTKRPLMPRLFRWVWLEEFVERFILRRADCVMIQNNNNRGFVLEKGVPKEKTAIFRVGNVIHRSHFVEPCKREDGSFDLKASGITSEKILLCISRLEILKLTDHVIRAVSILKNRGWNVKALFVGDGSIRDSMSALAEELQVKEQIVFCGNRDQEWLARVIPCVAAVISPLTGRALAEAALGGAPIVAYDIDWHSELIETGVTGELVPYLEFSEMAAATERILSNDEYARKLGNNVRRRAEEMMGPAINDNMQIAVYEKLLAQ